MKNNQHQFDKWVVPTIIGISLAVPVLVFLLIIFPSNILAIEADFPFFHALLNGSTAVLLFTGYVLIKSGKVLWHKRVMLSAFGLSTVFLVSYVLSKISNEPVPFGGDGIIRSVYFFILITHIILAAFVVPLALLAIYRGLTGQIDLHKRIVKWTFPIWFYVAVTGVAVYILMKPYY
jgi:putative membrane protein